MIHSVTGR